MQTTVLEVELDPHWQALVWSGAVVIGDALPEWYDGEPRYIEEGDGMYVMERSVDYAALPVEDRSLDRQDRERDHHLDKRHPAGAAFPSPSTSSVDRNSHQFTHTPAPRSKLFTCVPPSGVTTTE